MPIKPTVKKKQWHTERVQHQRTKDMRWFYNSRKWRKFSKQFKEKNPYCVECEKIGVYEPTKVTDHKQVFEVTPEAFDLDNLQDKYMQPLCNKCHAKKSGKEAHINKIK